MKREFSLLASLARSMSIMFIAPLDSIIEITQSYGLMNAFLKSGEYEAKMKRNYNIFSRSVRSLVPCLTMFITPFHSSIERTQCYSPRECFPKLWGVYEAQIRRKFAYFSSLAPLVRPISYDISNCFVFKH